MTLLLVALGLVLAGGVLALAANRSPAWSSGLGAGGVAAGCVAGLVPAVRVMLGGSVEPLHMAWEIPCGAFALALDPLSAFFLLPLLSLSALASVYGWEYLKPTRSQRGQGLSWFCFAVLVAAMILVVVARNGMLFLAAWEAMSLASFFLVMTDHEKPGVREAGWIYLVATHLGTAFILILFLVLGRGAESLDFDRFHAASPLAAGALFLMAVVGFGTKAGFMPFHVWLPEAHPAAPSHVSAVMSGVMIKTGIYGLARTLTWLGPPPAWWGWLLVGIGLSSGILGVLFALAQHDLKRLLAYHSVENIGIIALGMGVGLLGMHAGSPALAVLGWGGALLHVLNHALFKGLLFLGAGSVLHGTGTREIDHLGGLAKRMPWTSLTFLVGAVAISGLPPLNGFVSEFLIYAGAFQGAMGLGVSIAIPAVAVIAGLALIGGLATACFTKAFGIVFLGEPRGAHAAEAHESGWAMVLPMLALAAGCAAIGMATPHVIGWMTPVIGQVSGVPSPLREAQWIRLQGILSGVLCGTGLAVALAAVLALLRRLLLARRTVGETVTWDCGYAQPTPRMQYTASSFAQPLTDLLDLVLRAHRRREGPDGYFPKAGSWSTETPDACQRWIFRPVFSATADTLSRLRWLQHGHIQLYVLIIVLTLLALLAWQLV
jgi:formate hydrogenlyase subunit 3/multisubunit Na+/H+ antiporter MnhD subunit